MTGIAFDDKKIGVYDVTSGAIDHYIRNVLDFGGSTGLQPGEIDWHLKWL
jgi:hypothetical protein